MDVGGDDVDGCLDVNLTASSIQAIIQKKVTKAGLLKVNLGRDHLEQLKELVLYFALRLQTLAQKPKVL